ncbi:MAG: hypothetical protein J6Y80_05845, partial [Victivallales bacterium]|nr:hypothetical protein [Victivallales bacterium]
GRLELSRTSGGRVSLRRWMAECDPELEAKLAEAATAKLQQAVLKLRQELDHEDNTPLPTAPVSQPAQRDYRFTSYFAWSQPELLPKFTSEIEPKALKFNKQCAIDRTALEECGPAPAIRLDLAALAGQSHACRTDGACCWESNQAQNLFRRIIRQLASYTRSGTLVLDNLHPGWCDIGTHENRKHNARHWDLCAILDQIAWTRQALGPGWNLHVPQHGLWAELPSLACLGADNGFRVM